ncbi:exodeoxyribonuclease VII large subunit [Acetivibrio ethanolgignens]|uniref:Exodeoxyribonuclease 7 large subunit n=1 Tax=Acetivibrio ethanolgignens TaxID=290052 RepID=A0A0V8QFE6_9FIRM|nr:exodeoxyribonuclease VII large subunit [Acetivibrio ethanolgignens]KSV59317.1 exodeoxyribonuclease VII [Acetivibrio ethanolgignens]
MNSEQVYSVSQINLYIKNMFARESVLNQIYIKGEVSNCKYHTSGHIYFTLKDSKGQLACVMFAGQRSGLSFRMCEGQSVVVLGSISVYERDGKYQMYAREIHLDGTGALYEKYEQLKKELEQKGYFDSDRKKPIPWYVKRVGIVTASTGAAVQDIINISTRRNPYIQLILYPAKVQGEGAALSISRGIAALDKLGVDVIIAGRGGGSIEDLWAFNEKIVAETIYRCNTPVISAVGHETDTTIADYVADLRAPTPSAAAELAVCDIASLLENLREYNRSLNFRMRQKINQERSKLSQYELKLKYADPVYKVRQERQYLTDMEERLKAFMKQRVIKERHRLELYIERLRALSPLERLKMGYGYLEKETGESLSSAEAVKKGDRLLITMKDGKITAVAEKIEKGRPI